MFAAFHCFAHSPNRRFFFRPLHLSIPRVASGGRILLAGMALAAGVSRVPAQSLPPAATAPAPASPSTAPATPAPAPGAIEALHPTLDQISSVIAGLNISRWKAPSEVRVVAQQDVDSIHRDLSSSLPPLMERAKAAPASAASLFAVYRNIDAVYDVLLRVSETATLAGSQVDAKSLQGSLTSLESARRALGDAILQLAGSQEAELTSLRNAAAQAAAAAAAAPPPPPTKTVVEDGPATPPKAAPARRKKKVVAPAPPAAAPAPQQ